MTTRISAEFEAMLGDAAKAHPGRSDQVLAELTETAVFAGHYYRALLDAKIPPTLARELMSQWHCAWWSEPETLAADAPPPAAEGA